MEERSEIGGLAQVPSIELISTYINAYYDLEDKAKSDFAEEFRLRRLPLPALPRERPPAMVYVPKTVALPERKSDLDWDTFFGYMLLLYVVTGPFYAWYYLLKRLIKWDFGSCKPHKIILTLISITYITLEAILYDFLTEI
jgi:hypothetical protein